MTYTRFTRQVVTPEAYPATATAAATYAAFELLKTAPWVEQPGTTGGQYPTHAYAQPATLNPEWDAFNICCEYSAGVQRVMAGYAAYRFTLPPNAARDGVKITAAALRAVADKYNTTGARIAAFTNSAPLPNTCGIEIRTTGFATLEAQLKSDNPANPAAGTDKSQLLTLTPEDPPLAGLYLWIYVLLEDYTAYRGAWIEGGAGLVATTLAVDYDVAPANDGTYHIAAAPLPLGSAPALFRAVGHLFAIHDTNRLAWLNNGAWQALALPVTASALTHLANGILSATPAENGNVTLLRISAPSGGTPNLDIIKGNPQFSSIYFSCPLGEADLFLATNGNPENENLFIFRQVLDNELFLNANGAAFLSEAVPTLFAVNPDRSLLAVFKSPTPAGRVGGVVLRLLGTRYAEPFGTCMVPNQMTSVYNLETLEPCGRIGTDGDLGVLDMPSGFYAEGSSFSAPESLWQFSPLVQPASGFVIDRVFYLYSLETFFIYCVPATSEFSSHPESQLFQLNAAHSSTLVNGRKVYTLSETDIVSIPFWSGLNAVLPDRDFLLMAPIPGMLVFWSFQNPYSHGFSAPLSKLTVWLPSGETHEILDHFGYIPSGVHLLWVTESATLKASIVTINDNKCVVAEMLYSSPFANGSLTSRYILIADLVDDVILGGGALPESVQLDPQTLAFYTQNTRFSIEAI